MFCTHCAPTFGCFFWCLVKIASCAYFIVIEEIWKLPEVDETNMKSVSIDQDSASEEERNHDRTILNYIFVVVNTETSICESNFRI